MPAAAVIPAPLAYTIIVAVKRLVVGLNKLTKKKERRVLFLQIFSHTPICEICALLVFHFCMCVTYSSIARIF